MAFRDQVTSDDQVIACTLGNDELAAQGERWTVLFEQAAIARDETTQGLRVHFRGDADVQARLRALVAVENECCSWAQWSVEKKGDVLVLHISSTGDGVAVIHGLFTEVSVV